MLSTFVTFSEKCCFLSVLWSSDPILSRKVMHILPRARPDIRLHPYNSVLMDKRVCLADELHDIVPRSFYKAD